jgi:hypothetical protein
MAAVSDLSTAPYQWRSIGVTMEDWVASWFFERDGQIWCRGCGEPAPVGYQAAHYLRCRRPECS